MTRAPAEIERRRYGGGGGGDMALMSDLVCEVLMNLLVHPLQLRLTDRSVFIFQEERYAVPCEYLSAGAREVVRCASTSYKSLFRTSGLMSESVADDTFLLRNFIGNDAVERSVDRPMLAAYVMAAMTRALTAAPRGGAEFGAAIIGGADAFVARTAAQSPGACAVVASLRDMLKKAVFTALESVH